MSTDTFSVICDAFYNAPNNAMTIKEAAKASGKSESTVRKAIKHLEADGFLRRFPYADQFSVKKNAPVVYEIVPKDEETETDNDRWSKQAVAWINETGRESIFLQDLSTHLLCSERQARGVLDNLRRQGWTLVSCGRGTKTWDITGRPQ